MRSRLESGEVQLFLLARNNANRQQYQRYLQLQKDGLCQLAFVSPAELSGVASLRDVCAAAATARVGEENKPTDAEQSAAADEAMAQCSKALYMCVASVLHRRNQKDNEPHPTNSMTAAKLAQLPFTFLRMLEPHPAAFSLSFVSDSAPAPPAPFVDVVRGVLASGSGNGKNKRKKSDDDNDNNVDSDQDKLKQWGLDTPEHIAAVVNAAHRPLDALATDLAAELVRSVAVTELPPVGSYLGCTLTLESQTALTDQLAPPTKGWNQQATHVTLVHSHNYAANQALWKRANALTGVTVRVTPRALYDNADAALTDDDLPQVCPDFSQFFFSKFLNIIIVVHSWWHCQCRLRVNKANRWTIW